MKFVVDTKDDIDESNENDNELEKEFIWSGGPDLIVSDITLDPANPDVGDGTLTGVIKNQGNEDAGGIATVINVRMFLDGEECATGFIYNGIGAGEEATEDTDGCNPDTPGEHTIKYEIDWENDVFESDETNNTLEKKFTWSGADLVVTGIALEPAAPKSGEEVKFIGTIKNQGPYGTGLFVNINVTATLDGAECGKGLIVAGLGAGSEATEEISCTVSGEGPHTITFTVDVDQDVAETDETNNQFAQSFTVGAAGPITETCNGKDDDGDDKIDEDFTDLGKECDGDDSDACKGGKKVCSADGKGTTCKDETGAPAETCNGKDDDCDGKVDEDFPDVNKACVPASGCGTGKNACKADGSGIECKADTGAAAKETCNGKDDDCDGQTDEDFPELTKPCGSGIGACQSIGKYACAGGKAVCDAKPGPAGAEKCDLLDNDCDGIVDENCACQPGTYLPCGVDVGACALGVLECSTSGIFASACQGAVGPKNEACGNDLDDDCDGTTDEGCTCTGTATRACALATPCGAGTQSCSGGKWGPCVPTALGAEACGNGKDDDCDAEIDEGCTCTGAATVPCAAKDSCADYQRVCEAGKLSACEPIPGTEDAACGPTDGTDATDGVGVADGASDDTGGIIVPETDTSVGTGGDVGTGLVPVASGGSDCSAATPSSNRSPLAALTLLLALGALFIRRR